MSERTLRLCIVKLSPQYGDGLDQVLPCGLSVGETQPGKGFVRGRYSRAGCAVVEAENPYPAALEDMMDRRIIDWIGGHLGGTHLRDIIEPLYV